MVRITPARTGSTQADGRARDLTGDLESALYPGGARSADFYNLAKLKNILGLALDRTRDLDGGTE